MSSAVPPKTVIVVGGGIVGLSVAWHLQEYGVEVTVLDKTGVAAGSSWGNAGWLSPGLATPLPEPSVLRYGLRSLIHQDAPLYIPLSFNLDLIRFLGGFARRCTEKSWYRAMAAYVPLNNQALDAYDTLAESTDTLEVIRAPIVAAFERKEQAKDLLAEFEMITRAGQVLDTQELSGSELRSTMAHLSSAVRFAIRIQGQRYIDPGKFTTNLGDAVRGRGARTISGAQVTSVKRDGSRVRLGSSDGNSYVADAAVIATGAWINRLARPLGVKMMVQAGRGYSFSVPTSSSVPHPIYFPAIRVACTPLGESTLRVAGTMEFRGPDHRLEPSRITSIVRSATPLLSGVDWTQVENQWVGPRPVSADGMPLIGATRMPQVFIAGGHGMWGVSLGPVTGKLLTRQIVMGYSPPELHAFDPLR